MPLDVGAAVALKASDLLPLLHDPVNVFSHARSVQYLRQRCMRLKKDTAGELDVGMFFKPDDAVAASVGRRQISVQRRRVISAQSEDLVLIRLVLNESF